MERWSTRNDFAQLTTRAAVVYPRLPVSRFVCEVEVTSSARGGMKFSLGDAENACQICLDWIPERKSHQVLAGELVRSHMVFRW